jgi:hypothetical protein
LRIADELLIPSLLMHLGRSQGPMNHFIQAFDEAHTGTIHDEHIEATEDVECVFRAQISGRPAAAVRLRVLRELADSDAAAESTGLTSGT